jgi:hypothetical protein
MNEPNKKAVEGVRAQIWTLYRALKSYKLSPSPQQAEAISNRFDTIFQQKTAYVTLNRSLRQLNKLKSKLLLVLKRPEIPIHTNGSESDIRDYVKKRKSAEVPAAMWVSNARTPSPASKKHAVN